MKLDKKQYQDVEQQFFDLDDENNIAYLWRNFESPGEILDLNAFSKIPLMNSDFVVWLTSLFDYVPKKYKLDITVCFDDLEGFDEDELAEICRQNIMLELKVQNRKAVKTNLLALGLCVLGILMIILYFSLDFIWDSEGSLKEIIMFVLEILATVPFWGAADIFFVGNSEQREAVRSFRKRFHAIKYTGQRPDPCLERGEQKS